MIELLKESSLFGGCTPEQLEKVAALCERCTYPAGASICEAAAPADHLHVIERGIVELSFTLTCYGATQQITTDRMGRGDVVGWSSFTTAGTFTLSATASSDVTLLRILTADLDELFADSHFGHVVMRSLAGIIAQRFTIMQRMLIDMLQDRVVR